MRGCAELWNGARVSGVDMASQDQSRVAICTKVSLRDELVYLCCLGHLVQHLAFCGPRDRRKFNCARARTVAR
jgi:hypothetical protein